MRSPGKLFLEEAGRSRGWLWALFALALILGASIAFPRPFNSVENRLYDARVRLTPRPKPLKEIVLIDIDDSSVRGLGRWPWKRSVHARAVDVLTRCRAKLIVFDVVFHGPTVPEEDAALARAIEESGRVILPAGFGLVLEKQVVRLDLGDEDLALAPWVLPIDVDEVSSLYQVVRSFAPLNLFSQKGLGVGHISATPDSDGVFRRLPLIIGFDGRLFPSLDLLAAARYLDAGRMSFEPGEGLTLDGKDGPVAIPLDSRGNMAINFAGRWDQSFEHISFREVYEAHGSGPRIERLKGSVEGRLALISLVSSGTTDIGPTPLGSQEPLSVVHTNAINTILQGAFITGSSRGADIGVALFLAGAILALSYRLRPLWFIVSSGLVIALWVSANIAIFSRFRVALNLSVTTLAASASFIVLLVHGYLRAARMSSIQRNILKAYFWRGRARIKTKNFDAAFSDFERAVKLAPNYAPAYDNLGWLYGRRGKHDEKIRYLTRSIELNPKNGWTYYSRGQAYYAKSEFEKAFADAKKACDLGYKKGCEVYKKYKTRLK